MDKNKMFNRYGYGTDHVYYEEFGGSNDRSHCFVGYVKCKLVNTQRGPLLIPDLIFLDQKNKYFKWIQPLTFFPSELSLSKQNIQCSITLDISCKKTIEIKFTNKDFIKFFKDHSEFYQCEIYGPENLLDYVTGIGYFVNKLDPYLRLYHHTSAEAKKSILKHGYFDDSKGNFAGTKELEKIGYLYLTCLDTIINEADLNQIAMSKKKFILLQSDDKINKRKLHVLYRQTKQLEETIVIQVSVEAISPHHIHRHLDDGVFYSICTPFIFRVGVRPGTGIGFREKRLINKNIRTADYIVVGDGTSAEGLVAPYDEENTDYIYKIEKIKEAGYSNSLVYLIEY
ncbi:hypothetical protein BKP45_10440 [Anaerobacillus alkalidiazotrophicus]|uniref:Uncharacterized protein n=1 Tax=Anaerobacillus alkalidiazotrophicus TaxID=472963 RepID=A0A1S2M5M3_9BACI|nr:hypothetical protein [Anaerobacillus alkalidiazotrophicus]OIJ20082.1 hypothetical protein BKP45_10440 [Anaerobacillus alkalidiazotrophicus]